LMGFAGSCFGLLVSRALKLLEVVSWNEAGWLL